MRPLTLVVVLTFWTGALAQETDKKDSAKQAHEWLHRTRKKLVVGNDSVECAVALQVSDAPVKQMRKYAFAVGTTHYHFRIKGDSRAHWKEVWDGKGEIPTREAWYEGGKLYVRSSTAPKKLTPIEVGEGEGACIKRSLLEGGVLGWRLAHAFDNDEDGGGYVAIFEVKSMREEKLKDRPAVVIDVSLGFGFGPMRPRRAAGTSRIWIDKDSHLLLQRETSFDVGDDEKPAKLAAREIYSNWKFNQPIDNAVFHIDGMPAPDALVDAPAAPELFEVQQTRKFLGFDVKDFPKPQGATKFDELPKDAAPFRFDLSEREPSLPAPKDWYESRPSVVVKKTDGTEVEAYCGYDSKDKILPGHGFESTRVNRRHEYGGGSYHPQDVYVGKRVEGKIEAKLFFRDVGSHNTAPHSITLDSMDRCHLTVADVDLGQFNRFKLYWLIGDLRAGKWSDAWLIDHRAQFTSYAHTVSSSWKDSVHVVWSWVDSADRTGHKDSGLYYVQWTPAAFGRKQQIFKGGVRNAALAIDPDSGRLLVVIQADKIFVASKPAAGGWTAAAALPGEGGAVAVQRADKGRFIVRTAAKEWVLTPK